MLGAALAGFSWLCVLPIQLRGHTNNPYIGIVVFIVIPVICGRPDHDCAGILFAGRRIAHGLSARGHRRAHLRKFAVFFAVIAVSNIVIGTQGNYRAVQYIDVVFNRVRYPIESATESNRLVPSRGIWGQCHWNERFDAVKLRVLSHFQDGAANTQTQSVFTANICVPELKPAMPPAMRNVRRFLRWSIEVGARARPERFRPMLNHSVGLDSAALLNGVRRLPRTSDARV